MKSKYFDMIKSFYTKGYGRPKKFYTDDDIDNLVKRGKITAEEAEEIRGSGE